ncbi:helix-turn-helix domain-containing protein [Mesorhizobium sp. VK23A]|uniref:Helix-turn-helix domain-containing protein n=1 Tax=Mesorhizobium dulcispinae TaxID=3072316 RepID=A0ABU4XKX2_9HYPH|nr:helix-turn-helix domain-containing protein [Mesorhizobium sp. VK23B]MDX8475394.1 helix-turn-helix domain-containing protein [Mesorhizobium sp. VK23A]
MARLWMDSYRIAWQNQDSKLINQLYAANGRNYRGGPFSRAITKDDMITYWQQLTECQSENFLDFELVAAFEDRAFVLWRCLTTHPISRTRTCGTGAFILKFDGAACLEKVQWCVWSPFRTAAPAVPLSKVREAIRTIEESLGERVTISELAQASRLSIRHATRLVRLFTGFSPHQYLLRRRIVRARERLAWTDEPIVEIALDLGFASQSHFISAFKQITAFTPADYRARCSSTQEGPVKSWVRSLWGLTSAADTASLVQLFNMPVFHPAIPSGKLKQLCERKMRLEVLADTPSMALVHWALADTGDADCAMPSGSGVFHLTFTPEGTCRSLYNYSQWD